MPEFMNIEGVIALFTLAVLEIVLGIDNLVFISILSSKLPKERQPAARRLGLAAAMVTRIMLLLAIASIMKLQSALFELFGHPFSGKDLILIAGGLFLLAKATHEIHTKIEPSRSGSATAKRAAVSFAGVIIQIMLLDVVFSIDSVVTAVGMAQHVEIMIAAVVIAAGVMIAFAESVSAYIEKHPTLKMLALSFLLLIGVTLIADGLGRHVEKGYIYFAMAFSFFVEMLNRRASHKQEAAR